MTKQNLSMNDISVRENAKLNAERTSKIVEVRARAFTGEGVREHRVKVSRGEVLVWDSIAGHYTSCHALSARAVRRIRRLAAQ